MAQDMSFAAETTTDSDYANVRNFYKVELWTKDDQRVERLLHAGNRIDARAAFNAAVKHRPRGRYTIRQRCRVIEQWPITTDLKFSRRCSRLALFARWRVCAAQLDSLLPHLNHLVLSEQALELHMV
jgi:hypothetical protein